MNHQHQSKLQKIVDRLPQSAHAIALSLDAADEAEQRATKALHEAQEALALVRRTQMALIDVLSVLAHETSQR